jgi:hypothetical protein
VVAIGLAVGEGVRSPRRNWDELASVQSQLFAARASRWRDEKLRLPHRTDHAGIVARRSPVNDPPPNPPPQGGRAFLRPRRLLTCHPSSKQKHSPQLRQFCQMNNNFHQPEPRTPEIGSSDELNGSWNARDSFRVGKIIRRGATDKLPVPVIPSCAARLTKYCTLSA